MKGLKKLACLTMAGAMSLSLCATALAADETKVTGSTNVPTINVTVPGTAAVTVNPYGLEVDMSAAQDNSDMKHDQILSPVTYISSTTKTALRVSATVTGEAKGDAILATSSIRAASKPATTKSVFMYFEIGKATANDGNGDPTWADAYNAKSPNQILVGTTAATKDDVVTITKSNGTAATYAAFRLAGDAVESPSTAWASTDTVDVTIAFTFLPTVEAAPATP